MKDVYPASDYPLRSPERVMRLRRMGASFPTRLSFLRILLRKLAAENAKVTQSLWEIDSEGYGHAVYTLRLCGSDYSLVAVSTYLPSESRTDRVIATAWDTAYVLYDGIPDASEVARIVNSAPKQEAARYTERDLVLSRANKSVRLFDHVTSALKMGQQPDAQKIRETGYLMRTTAVYGNGKFGIADRSRIAERPGLNGPFMAEMLTVWLIRGFTHDLAEHVGGAKLSAQAKRHLGIGNSTGLGMAPFLVTHPLLLDAWVQARETALARVRGVQSLDPDQISRIYELVARTAQHLAEWDVSDNVAAERIAILRAEWPEFAATLAPEAMTGAFPINRILSDSEQWSVDTQELIAALVLEPFGELIDGLAENMSRSCKPQLDPKMDCGALSELISTHWGWACDLDFNAPEHCAQFWYVSEEKLEPRLGNRFEEQGADRESPMDVARKVHALSLDLVGQSGLVADFLAHYPQHRATVRRVQMLSQYPYAEIRDNLIGIDCLPIDLLRCKLAFFGAAKFDPKSDRWTRITLAQGAPLFDELDEADDWWLPVCPI